MQGKKFDNPNAVLAELLEIYGNVPDSILIFSHHIEGGTAVMLTLIKWNEKEEAWIVDKVIKK